MLDGLITRRSKVQILSPLFMESDTVVLPVVDDLVLCTVTNIQFHSVFVKLDEFDVSGMIHISEVSPGRIKNLREFVQEGKKIVCKVLRIDREKGHIDLSLRRVSESQRRAKMESLRQDAIARSLVKQASVPLKIEPEVLWKKLSSLVVSAGYDSLFLLFEDVSSGAFSLSGSSLSSAESDGLESVVKSRLKPPVFESSGVLSVSSYASNGVDIVREGLSLISKNSDAVLRYLGGGNYSVKVSFGDPKSADKLLDECVSPSLDFFKKKNAVASFVRS